MSPADGDSAGGHSAPALGGSNGRFTAAIDGADRAGEDPRLTDEFELIGNELAKIGGVEQEPVDWKKVSELSAQLLHQNTKDMRCGVYWAFAQLQISGLPEFYSAVVALAELFETFGKELHPRRPKGRVAATIWFAERLEEALQANEVELTGGEVDAIRSPMERCANVLRELELDTQPMDKALSALSLIPTVASQEEREEEIRQGFPEGFADIGLAMLKTADVAGDDPHSLLKLRMRRWALWMEPPPLVDANARDCVIAHDLREELERLSGSSRWADLLQRAEEVFVTSPFWLDLSYWAAKAAGFVMGPSAEAAIVGELRGLLGRAPEMVENDDRNGHPLASPEVREWLAMEVLVAEGGKGGEDLATTVIPVELHQLMGQGRMREAMVSASEWIQPCYGRVRFARSVALANAFNEFGATQQSFMVFRGLHSQLRQMTVREWEPQLFAACIEGYLSSKKRAMGLGPEDEPLLEELSTLDPTAVMEVLSA